MMSQRFEELWSEFLEGELDDTSLANLQQMLLADAELLRRATDLYEEHRLLGFELQPFDEQRFVNDAVAQVERDGRQFVGSVIAGLGGTGSRSVRNPQGGSRPRRRRWSGYALVAAASVLVSFVIQSFVGHSASTEPVEQQIVEQVRYQPVEYVATLIHCQECQWDSLSLAEGSRLTVGDLKLNAGSAVIQFDGGAMALLNGPVQLRVESAGGAELLAGDVMIRAPEEAAGFVLRTPASDIVDLGTEFSVHVEAGATEVHVAEGEVEWHKPGQNEHAMGYLAQGQAMRFDPQANDEAQPIPLAGQRFSDAVALHAQHGDGGRLLAYEPFDYPFDKTPTQRRQANGGVGWASPWVAGYPGSSFDLTFSPLKNLTATTLAESVGGSLELPDDPWARLHRPASKRQFAEDIDLDQDGTTYFSFLVKRDTQRTANGQGSFHWILCQPQDFKSRLGVGILSDGRPIVFGPSGNAVGDSPLNDGATWLFVGKLVRGKDRPDQLFLKVLGSDERLERAEPLDWTVVGRTGRQNQKLSQVHIYNAPGRTYLVDELRIGTSWRSVTPLK